MHFAKIPDEPIETIPVCISTDTTKTVGRESSSESSSEGNSGDSEDERVQRLANLQEQVADCIDTSFYIL